MRVLGYYLGIVAIIAAIFPSIMLLLVGLVLWLTLLPVLLPKIISQPDASSMTMFCLITSMVIGGVLGLIAISLGIAFPPDRMRLRPKVKYCAWAFGCAGISAVLIYILEERVSVSGVDLFAAWLLGGPVAVGVGIIGWNILSTFRKKTLLER